MVNTNTRTLGTRMDKLKIFGFQEFRSFTLLNRMRMSNQVSVNWDLRNQINVRVVK